MLNDIQISNYRTFSSLEVNFSSRVNLIVGANNSGKSSLLEAIYLLTSINLDVSLFQIFNERGDFISRAAEHRYGRRGDGGYQTSSAFFGRNNRIGQKFVITSKSPSYRTFSMMLGDGRIRQQQLAFIDEVPNLKSREQFLTIERIKDDETINQYFRMVDDGIFEEVEDYSSGHFDLDDQNSIFVTTNSIGYNQLAAIWDTITLTPREDQVVEALRILEPDVERLSFTSRQSASSGVLVKMRGEPHPVSLGSLGDGMRRALVIAAALVSVENGALLVDEIDTGLYHGVLADIWSLILETSARRNVKVFATTHSWDCVRAFQAALQKRNEDNAGQLIRLEKLKGGLVRPIYYSGDELEIAIQQNIEVR